jgi:hypothetical protein
LSIIIIEIIIIIFICLLKGKSLGSFFFVCLLYLIVYRKKDFFLAMLDCFESPASLKLVRELQEPIEHDYSLEILHKMSDDASSDASRSSNISSTRALHARELGPTTRGYCAKLFEDALNSSDPVELGKIFRSFIAPTCYMDAYGVDSPGNMDSEETMEVRVVGLENLITYFSAYIIAIPDSIFLIHEWRVFERRSGQSCVVFRYSLSGNQILPHDQSCHIREAAQIPAPKLPGRKRKFETSHTIKFKDTGRGHTTISEQSRRQRVRTLGEFIADNRVLPGHRPEISEIQSDVIQEVWPHGLMPGTGLSVVSENSNGEVFQDSVCRSKSSTGDESSKKVDSLASASDSSSPDRDITFSETGSVTSQFDMPITNLPPFLLLPAALSVNIRGVMRFHIGEDGLVRSIYCSHFSKFNE